MQMLWTEVKQTGIGMKPELTHPDTSAHRLFIRATLLQRERFNSRLNSQTLVELKFRLPETRAVTQY